MAELLNEAEKQIVADLADISSRMANVIIAQGPNFAPDWNEAALHIHGIQNMILKQAAARAYPDVYRLLGESLRG